MFVEFLCQPMTIIDILVGSDQRAEPGSQVCSFASFGNFEVNKNFIFGNYWQALLLTEMRNIARNGKKVTEVLYREADQSFYCHFWQ